MLDRDKDFIMMFVNGHLVVLPVAQLDDYWTHDLDPADTAGFLALKGFMIDERAMQRQVMDAVPPIGAASSPAPAAR